MGKISVVAIERQYCSGGSEIGRLVAEKLGINCYDREIIEMAAERMGISFEEVKKLEESVINPLMTPISFRLRREKELDSFEKVFAAETEIITEIAKREPCVIVGRCAGYILKNVVPTLKVYIYSTQESRKARAIDEHGIDPDDVESVLRRYDKKRGDFFNVNTQKNWSSMLTYDVCFNSSTLGTQGCADAIVAMASAAKKK
ncbi:MAG: cytidylate kinase-like family protein [Ruminococcus sp.]|nr:cytidylate kinase-like family protein [Ruminococcus sp.]